MLNKSLTVSLLQKWAVPLLLIVVTLRQMVVAYNVGLSPWHGGGWGMFSSVDRDERRLILVEGTDNQGKLIKINSTSLKHIFSDRDLILIRTFPRKSLLQKFAQKILDSQSNVSQNPGVKQAIPANLQKVKVQVWRLHHNRETSSIHYETLSPGVEAKR
ncbi:MAG: hypothetical protein QNJ47_27990 [Nostocaceae cyanobacterium]|nr:hypothetical protein [Nostocaceae cyanobacterium]